MGEDRVLKGQNKLTPEAASREHKNGHDHQLPIFRSEEAHPIKKPQDKPGRAQAQPDMAESSQRAERKAATQSKKTGGKRKADQPQDLKKSETQKASGQR